MLNTSLKKKKSCDVHRSDEESNADISMQDFVYLTPTATGKETCLFLMINALTGTHKTCEQSLT